MLTIIKLLIKLYQRDRSLRRPYRVCRFEPSCSNYMLTAIDRFGYRGILMGLNRILRCRPGVPGGYDLVPDHFTINSAKAKKVK